ncbi:MAG: hypothetical protein AAGA32_22800 [Pseudomonadota bacterium]
MTAHAPAPGQTHIPLAAAADLVSAAAQNASLIVAGHLSLTCPPAESIATLIAEYSKLQTAGVGGPSSAKDAWLSTVAETADWPAEGFGCRSDTNNATFVWVGSVGLGHTPDLAQRALEEAERQGCAGAAAQDHVVGILGSCIDRDNARSSVRLAEALGAGVDTTAVCTAPEDLVCRQWTGAAR